MSQHRRRGWVEGWKGSASPDSPRVPFLGRCRLTSSLGFGFGCCPLCRARPKHVRVHRQANLVSWRRGRRQATFAAGSPISLCDGCTDDVIRIADDTDSGMNDTVAITIDWAALAAAAADGGYTS